MSDTPETQNAIEILTQDAERWRVIAMDMKAQRDRLVDALQSIRKQVRGTARHDATIERISIIVEVALAAVKGGSHE